MSRRRRAAAAIMARAPRRRSRGDAGGTALGAEEGGGGGGRRTRGRARAGEPPRLPLSPPPFPPHPPTPQLPPGGCAHTGLDPPSASGLTPPGFVPVPAGCRPARLCILLLHKARSPAASCQRRAGAGCGAGWRRNGCSLHLSLPGRAEPGSDPAPARLQRAAPPGSCHRDEPGCLGGRPTGTPPAWSTEGPPTRKAVPAPPLCRGPVPPGPTRGPQPWSCARAWLTPYRTPSRTRVSTVAARRGGSAAAA